MTTTVTRDTSRQIRPFAAGCDEQGRYTTRTHRVTSMDDCAEEGGIHADPKPTIQPGPLLGLVLVLTGWPLAAALVAVAFFIAEHLPKIPG